MTGQFFDMNPDYTGANFLDTVVNVPDSDIQFVVETFLDKDFVTTTWIREVTPEDDVIIREDHDILAECVRESAVSADVIIASHLLQQHAVAVGYVVNHLVGVETGVVPSS